MALQLNEYFWTPLSTRQDIWSCITFSADLYVFICHLAFFIGTCEPIHGFDIAFCSFYWCAVYVGSYTGLLYLVIIISSYQRHNRQHWHALLLVVTISHSALEFITKSFQVRTLSHTFWNRVNSYTKCISIIHIR